MTQSGVLAPGAYNARFVRVFAWYTRRLVAKKFNALRLTPGSRERLIDAGQSSTPVIVLLNHSSWWDPLLLTVLGTTFMPGRPAMAPMERAQWDRFRFFRKLGLFGLDPESSGAMEAMTEFVTHEFQAMPGQTLWITPQGRFADVRVPVRIRPGAPAIAALTPGVRVLAASAEYCFWVDQRPEALVSVDEVAPPERNTTAGWLRVMTRAMQRGAATLAERVISRDPGSFEAVLGGDDGKINPLYDVWLKLRGKSGAIEPERERTSRSVR